MTILSSGPKISSGNIHIMTGWFSMFIPRRRTLFFERGGRKRFGFDLCIW